MYYWVAKDKDGTETKFSRKPILEDDYYVKEDICSDHYVLPEGTIEKLIGCKPEWWDGPYEVVGDYYAPVGREKYYELIDELENLQKLLDSDYCIALKHNATSMSSSIVKIDYLKNLIEERINEINQSII